MESKSQTTSLSEEPSELPQNSRTQRKWKPMQEKNNRPWIDGPKMDETNRDKWGTWKKSYDFTLTVLAYVMGIYNFWRFPYLCYKFGGAFFVPYLIVLLFVGIPIIFMEFTVGQYFSVGPTDACARLAPILTGVSYILAWNAMINCVLYAMLMSWSRFYASEATTCYRGWETCNELHYYNTFECFTGEADDYCEDIDRASLYRRDPAGNVQINESTVKPAGVRRLQQVDLLYFRFNCTSLEEFCQVFGAKHIPGSKTCLRNGTNRDDETFSVYQKRTNAASEHFYGAVTGLIRRREIIRREQDYDPTNASHFEAGQELIESEESHSGIYLKLYCITTWLILAIFLYNGLLSVSIVSYLINAVPLCLLVVFTAKALSFTQAIVGIDRLIDHENFLQHLLNANMWAEAVIQVISTMGVGTGVLITLATFNKFHSKFLFDTWFAAFLNLLTSICAAVICFCTVGHYISYFRMNIPFDEYIQRESTTSSIEFGYIVYTHFMTLLHDQHYAVFLFFFMITSFSTDSSATLDTLVAIIPGLGRRRFTALLGICAVGFIALFPMTQNGGIVIFIEFEYFTHSFVTPFVCLVEVTGFAWVYGAKEIADKAEEMKIVNSRFFRCYLISSLKYFAPASLLLVLVVKAVSHSRIRFNNRPTKWEIEVIFWVFTALPVIILTVKILTQIIITKKMKLGLRTLLKSLEATGDASSWYLATGGASTPSVSWWEGNEAPGPIPPIIEKWKNQDQLSRQYKERFHLIPNAPLRKEPASVSPPLPPHSIPKATRELGVGASSPKIGKHRRLVRRRRSGGGAAMVRRNLLAKTRVMEPVDDEVIAMEPNNEEMEGWKSCLLCILRYFDEWPGRFDEESELDEEVVDESESSVGSDSSSTPPQ